MDAPKIFTPEFYARMRMLEEGSWWNAGMRARWRTVGLDVALAGLKTARAWGETVLSGSALRIPLPDASADAIISLDVLQHLPLGGGDLQALAELHRVLRPQGILLLRTNAQALPRSADDPRFDFQEYDAAELRQKLVASGFSVRRLGRVNSLLGLFEIPRELRARRSSGPGYTGLRTQPVPRSLLWPVKLAWLRLEGILVAAGFSLPLGRTLVAVARATVPRPL